MVGADQISWTSSNDSIHLSRTRKGLGPLLLFIINSYVVEFGIHDRLRFPR